MKKFKRLSILIISLTVALLLGLSITAGAVCWICDINGDNKITVLDAQLIAEYKAGLRTLDKKQQVAANSSTISGVLDYILEKSQADMGDLNGDLVYEIYTVDALFDMAKNPDQDYILMADLDLAGAQWTPVVGFSGNFNGNGHTISNISITTSTPSCYALSGAAINMGFFGDLTSSAVVTDLHLRNVTLTASEEAMYLGLLAGTGRGQFINCTATGTIIDERPAHGTTADDMTWIGALVGRITNVQSGQTPGSVIGGTSLSVSDDAGVATTEGLCANVKLLIEDADGVNVAHKVPQDIGLVGWHPSCAAVSGIWCDSSNSSSLMSEDIQSRQNKMIAHMNEMGTIQWTPAEDLKFVPENSSGKTYYAGTTYTGLPYTHNNGSMARFLSAMQTQNADGVYTTQTGLGDSIYYVDDDSIGGYDGFVQRMGNNCSSAVSYAWMQASPVLVKIVSNQANGYHGGVAARVTKEMIPNDTNRVTYGIYPVGRWSDFRMIDPETGKYTDVPYAASKAAYVCSTETYSGDVLANNGAKTMLEAYAQARRADALVAYATTWYKVPKPGGHVRLIVADPIVIRNTNGSIDADKSYIITTEQGAEDVASTTWRVNWQYSFRELLDDPSDANFSGQSRTYLPITIRALHDTELRQSYVSQDAVTGPTTGRLYSNYRFISSTVTVKDGNRVIYCGEVFTGVGRSFSETAGQFNWAYMDAHADGFAAAAKAAGLQNGTYTFSVQALLADGKTVSVITNKTFTYHADA